MKRTKSTLTLRNLAMSIKKSIQLDEQKTAKKEYIPLKPSKSVAHCMPKERNSEQRLSEKYLNREQKQNKVFVLQRQITILEKQLKEYQNSQRGHNKELQEYEEIMKAQLQSEKNISREKTNGEQIRNQILMLQEDIFSCEFNMESRIAEKQYHQEIVDAYRHQYEAQSSLVIKVHQIQQSNIRLRDQIRILEESKMKQKLLLDDWKQDIKFDLNEHKLKNNVKLIRTKLISLQDKCDQFCIENRLRKIRELYCLYFKNYSLKNEVGEDQSEAGIDIFICKKKLSQDFGQFIRERLVYNKPPFPLIDQYLSNLTKMEEIYTKSTFEHHKKTHALFLYGLEQIQKLKQNKQKEIQENDTQLQKLTERIDELFYNDSIAVIEYLREKNQNTYNIKEIKQKLRESKRQQKDRIQLIKKALVRIQQLDKIIQNSNFQQTKRCSKEQIQQLSEHLISSDLQLTELERTYFHLLKCKNTIEDKIHQTVTEWREIDQKKEKLKKLYQQLEEVNNLQDKFQMKPDYIPKEYQELKYKHSKNTSIASLQQSKSILSLSQPYKKMMEKSAQVYQPILANCQMILSNKLVGKDQDFRCYGLKESRIKKEATSILIKDKSKSSMIRKSTDKQNHKYSIAGKKQLKSTGIKGNQISTQRQSLSRLLISRFNR